MTSVEFLYRYSDGNNFKKPGSVVFANPEGIGASTIEATLTQTFWDDGLFIAHPVRIPEVFLFLDGPFAFDDHCFHEFVAAQASEKAANDEHGRTIGEFLSEVIREDQKGWQVFDPTDYYSWENRANR
jgi:hypothetical protein